MKYRNDFYYLTIFLKFQSISENSKDSVRKIHVHFAFVSQEFINQLILMRGTFTHLITVNVLLQTPHSSLGAVLIQLTWNAMKTNLRDIIFCSASIQLGRNESIVDEKCIFTFANQITACYVLGSGKWILAEGLYVSLLFIKSEGHEFPITIMYCFLRDSMYCILIETVASVPAASWLNQKKELEREPQNMLIHSPYYSANGREID